MDTGEEENECRKCIYYHDNFDEPWCHKDDESGWCRRTKSVVRPK